MTVDLSKSKVGSTVYFKCGGKSVLTKSEPSETYPYAIYFTFAGNRKYGVHYSLDGHLYSKTDNKKHHSIFSIVKIKVKK